jgi:hypothetical protein
LVRLEVEVKPLGVAFDGAGLLTGPLTNTGTPNAMGSSVPLAANRVGLTLDTPYHWRLRLRSDSPFFPGSRWFWMPMNAPTETDLRTRAFIGIEDVAQAPRAGAMLEASVPNPFRTATEIAYTLPHAGRHRLVVYDVMGRKVVQLADEVRDGGRRTVHWNGRDGSARQLPAGVYLVELEFEGRTESQKITIAR